MSIDYVALATYDLDGTVMLTKVPIHESDMTQGFVYKNAPSSVSLANDQMAIEIRLGYHNSMEDTDPYYRVSCVANYSGSNKNVSVPAYTYVYKTSVGDEAQPGQFYVFATKDDEILCSLPEVSVTDSTVASGHCYFDYDFWRISTKYMPNLIPAN